MTSTFTAESASTLSAAELAALFNLSFTGYIGGKVEFTRESLLNLLCRDGVDLNLSQLVMREGKPLGFALIARQGWSSRVAGMGIIPEAQGQGVGKWLLDHVTEEARKRGERTMVLEAFEQNTRAVDLYQRVGFRIMRRLYAFDAESLPADEEAGSALTEIDPYKVARMVMAHGSIDLPWQVAGAGLIRIGQPTRAYQLDDAYALVLDTPATMLMRVLFVAPESRKQGQGARLIKALGAHYAGRGWHLPQLFPEEMAGFFEKCGFTRDTKLNQVQMEMSLFSS